VILSVTGFMKGYSGPSIPAKRLRFLEDECALAGGVLRTAVRNRDITFSCELGTGSILSSLQI